MRSIFVFSWKRSWDRPHTDLAAIWTRAHTTRDSHFFMGCSFSILTNFKKVLEWKLGGMTFPPIMQILSNGLWLIEKMFFQYFPHMGPLISMCVRPSLRPVMTPSSSSSSTCTQGEPRGGRLPLVGHGRALPPHGIAQRDRTAQGINCSACS